jgi:hypothetical protein
MLHIIGYEGLQVVLSRGMTRSGEKIYYVRPDFQCMNRSRRCLGQKRLEDTIKKWFSPDIKRYAIRGRTIGSNSPKHALMEYNRVCGRQEKGTVEQKEVIELNNEI